MKTIELPCEIGDSVYVIKVDWRIGKNCPHGKETKSGSTICRESGKNYDCPPRTYSVEEKICEAFVIDNEGVSPPGWIDPYEGFFSYAGCDDKVYYSKTQARLMAEKYQKEQNHLAM